MVTEEQIIEEPPKVILEHKVNGSVIVLYEDGLLILEGLEKFMDRTGNLNINDDAFIAVLGVAINKRNKING